MAGFAAHAPTKNGSPTPAETAVWESLSALCLLAALGMTWGLLHACVACDSAGLRWRGLGGWKFVRRDAISDYYEKLPSGNQRGSRASVVSLVEFPAGKCSITTLWSGADALRAQVAQRAVYSRSQCWEVKGTRSVDPWPRVFDYNTLENHWAPRIWLKLFLIFVVYLLVQPALQLGAMAGLVGWTMTLITAGLYLLLMGSIGLIFLFPLAQYRAAERRKAERITVSLHGIVFEDGTQRVEASWLEVSGYRAAYDQGTTGRYVVETRWGDFDFLPSIRDSALLRAIVQRHAVRAAGHSWGSRANSDALGGEAARWSGGEAGSGARVFHYQTRSNRAALVGVAFLGFVYFLLVVSGVLGWLPLPVASPLAVLGVFIGWIGALLLGWRGYKRNAIALDENGLTQKAWFGSRSLPWEQVQNYQPDSEGGGRIIGRAQIIRFSSLIVGRDELKSEIARRSAGCGGTWEKPTKSVPDGRRRGRTGPR